MSIAAVPSWFNLSWYVHYYKETDCILREIRFNPIDIKYVLTFDESLSHQVVVHRLRNNFGNLIAVKLNKRVAFAVSCLQAESCNSKWSVSHFTFIIYPNLVDNITFSSLISF